MSDLESESLLVPKTTVAAILKDSLPEHMRCGGDTKDLLTLLCTQFIQQIASEANELADNEGKKTIMPSHVLGALESMGFSGPDWDEEIRKAGDVSKQAHSIKAKNSAKSKWKNQTMTQEELLAEQERLHARALAFQNLEQHLGHGHAALEIDSVASSSTTAAGKESARIGGGGDGSADADADGGGINFDED
eukprot:ANDGO_01413.mRNA.1 Protein Dr1 homolog